MSKIQTEAIQCPPDLEAVAMLLGVADLQVSVTTEQIGRVGLLVAEINFNFNMGANTDYNIRIIPDSDLRNMPKFKLLGTDGEICSSRDKKQFLAMVVDSTHDSGLKDFLYNIYDVAKPDEMLRETPQYKKKMTALNKSHGSVSKEKIECPDFITSYAAEYGYQIVHAEMETFTYGKKPSVKGGVFEISDKGENEFRFSIEKREENGSFQFYKYRLSNESFGDMEFEYPDDLYDHVKEVMHAYDIGEVISHIADNIDALLASTKVYKDSLPAQRPSLVAEEEGKSPFNGLSN